MRNTCSPLTDDGFFVRRQGQDEEDHGHDDDGGRDEGHDGHPAGARRAVPDGRQGHDHQQNSVGPVADHHAQEADIQVQRARDPRDALFVGRVAVRRQFGRLRRRRRNQWRMGQEVLGGGRGWCRPRVGVQLLQAVMRHHVVCLSSVTHGRTCTRATNEISRGPTASHYIMLYDTMILFLLLLFLLFILNYFNSFPSHLPRSTISWSVMEKKSKQT